MEIDEGLYSRQIAVYGKNAMKSLASSNVLVIGFNTSALELSKNLILGGISDLYLISEQTINKTDLSSNYYLKEEDINKNILEVVYQKLSELNPYVSLHINEEHVFSEMDVVILVNDNLSLAKEINKKCRDNNNKFIWMNTYGLMGNVFCDFGEEFIIKDNNGEPLLTSILSEITEDGTFITIENNPHNLEVGDNFILTAVKGIDGVNNKQLTIEKIIDRNTFIVKESMYEWDQYLSGGQITQVKKEVMMNFKPLDISLNEPNLVNFDMDGYPLHNLFKKLLDYKEERNCLPNSWNKNDYKYFEDLDDYKYNWYFSATVEGKFLPVDSVIGSYTAQEVIKAITHKYTPTNQWYYYNCYDILPNNFEPTELVRDDRYDGMRMIFGEEYLNKIRERSVFIVGSGAIGCEHLKNFSMMGFGSKDSNIFITDMDTIERSNLNRQFLFRMGDIGKLKSDVASREAMKMNTDVSIVSHQNKICPDTEDIYDNKFFNSIDIVANALDNIAARLYVDQRCMFFDKPLFESGTLGTKGNTQVIIPRITENYGASNDPQEKSFPVCTVKNFPNQIEHTIHWARNEFAELFNGLPLSWNTYVSNPICFSGMTGNERGEMIHNISYLWKYKTTNFNDCVTWALDRFYDKFRDQIAQLLKAYPKDTLTSSGAKFWSSGKKCPTPIEFDTTNQLHRDYVINTSFLLAKVFNISIPKVYDFDLIIKSYKPRLFIATDEQISVDDKEEAKRSKTKYESLSLESLPPITDLGEYKLNIIEFEKDDDSNHHIDFITACSNLRALNYEIEPADRFNTKLIAGKIIPAISTTTSIVSGLVAIEMVKYCFGKNSIEDYKNTFLNLGVSYMGPSEPMPCNSFEVNGRHFTDWDNVNITNDMTIQELLDKLTDEFGTEIDTLVYSNKMLISPMTGPSKKMKRLVKNISDVLKEFNVKMNKNIYELQADSLFSEEDINLPSIRFFYQ